MILSLTHSRVMAGRLPRVALQELRFIKMIDCSWKMGALPSAVLCPLSPVPCWERLRLAR